MPQSGDGWPTVDDDGAPATGPTEELPVPGGEPAWPAPSAAEPGRTWPGADGDESRLTEGDKSHESERAWPGESGEDRPDADDDRSSWFNETGRDPAGGADQGSGRGLFEPARDRGWPAEGETPADVEMSPASEQAYDLFRSGDSGEAAGRPEREADDPARGDSPADDGAGRGSYWDDSAPARPAESDGGRDRFPAEHPDERSRDAGRAQFPTEPGGGPEADRPRAAGRGEATERPGGAEFSRDGSGGAGQSAPERSAGEFGRERPVAGGFALDRSSGAEFAPERPGGGFAADRSGGAEFAPERSGGFAAERPGGPGEVGPERSGDGGEFGRERPGAGGFAADRSGGGGQSAPERSGAGEFGRERPGAGGLAPDRSGGAGQSAPERPGVGGFAPDGSGGAGQSAPERPGAGGFAPDGSGGGQSASERPGAGGFAPDGSGGGGQSASERPGAGEFVPERPGDGGGFAGEGPRGRGRFVPEGARGGFGEDRDGGSPAEDRRGPAQEGRVDGPQGRERAWPGRLRGEDRGGPDSPGQGWQDRNRPANGPGEATVRVRPVTPPARQDQWPPPEPPRAAPWRVEPRAEAESDDTSTTDDEDPRTTTRGGRRRLVITLVAVVAVLGLGAGAVFAVPGLSDRLGITDGEPEVVIDPPAAPVAFEPGLRPPDGAAPAPTAAGVQAALAGPASSPALGTLTGVVVDPVSGETLWQSSPDTPLTPASTGKLLTAAAALLSVEHTTQLSTKVVEGSEPGSVIIVGGGDPTLSSLKAGVESVYPGAAHLGELVDQVKKSGVPVQTVQVDLSRYTGDSSARGWLPADIAAGYITPIVPAMLDGGRSDAKAQNGTRTANPARALAEEFAARLGASVPASADQNATEGAKVLGEVRSAPLVELVDTILRTSDNVLAETIAREVALAAGKEASFDGGSEATLQVLGDNGFDTNGAVLADGSGLSTEDRVPAKLLGEILTVAAAPDGDDPRTAKLRPLLGGLPVAGGSGTLDDRYGTQEAVAGKGYVRAKTGTLSGVNSLAGVVLNQDGRVMVFALMTGDTDSSARPALDAIAATLRGCGCG